jgi:hypothetical protein
MKISYLFLIFILERITTEGLNQTSLESKNPEYDEDTENQVTKEWNKDDDDEVEKAPEKNTTSASLIKAEDFPSAAVVLPIRRQGTSSSELNKGPCGGVAKKKADTLTNRGSYINVVWETHQPVQNGNCTVRISPGLDKEENFTLLYPKKIATDATGSFPCGRVQGFENQQFSLPEDYVCDQCTLQWTWLTPFGNIFSCSDIIINGNKIEDCLARCKNGGACFNGKCICDSGFYGEFCQYSCKILT